MAMTIMNNTSAMLTLGELNKNTTALGKQLKKVSSGMKIVGAGDGASEYSISEKMRVRIRALDQNEENVQKGMSLLRVAEGGIQSQIELLKTVKQKVLDAANDTNTDMDRQTIQKEITQSYDQMEDIACEMDYNTQKVLLGDTFWKQVVSWEVLDHSVLVENSDSMGVIPDVVNSLDGKYGPFDVFNEYNPKPTNINSLGITATPQNFSGGTDGNPNTITMDLSTYTSVSQLNNVGFSIGGINYVLTQAPSNNYLKSGNVSPTIIDIRSCNSVSDVATTIASRVNINVTSAASGNVVTFTTREKSSAIASNAVTVTGYASQGKTVTSYSGGQPKLDPLTINVSASSTGAFGSHANLTGGLDSVSHLYSDADSANGFKGVKASITRSIASAPSGSGIKIYGPNSHTYVNGHPVDSSYSYLQFINGSSGLSYNSNTGVYTIGKQANTSGNIGGLDFTLSGGNITFTAPTVGTAGNNYYISDGFNISYTHPGQPYIAPSPSGTTTYTPVTAIDTTGVTNHKTGTDGTFATYSINVSSYADSTNLSDLENLIDDLYGKAIVHSGAEYHFTDSTTLGLDDFVQAKGIYQQLDLNKLRTTVAKGDTIGNALASMIQTAIPSTTVNTNGNGNVDTIILQSFQRGTIANSETIWGEEEGLRSYDIDYGTWFENNPTAEIPEDLYYKGFRAYCATCSNQWFNFLFIPEMPEDADECTESGTSTEDIKTIRINVSKVTDAASLVQAIYEQATPILKGQKLPNLNSTTSYDHFMRLAADTTNGILTIYDNRRHPVNDTSNYPEHQERGAKIADGCFDNVVPDLRDLYIKEIIIQDTDHASRNLRLEIPQTTMDHIFGFNPSYFSITDYNVLSKNHRDRLLGPQNKNGILDKGIKYLLSANTLVGSQIQRLESSNNNIVTANENTQAAESTIRDADMAKEMTGFVKANVLSQSAQSMLAQANQNASSVLSLLQ